MKPVKLGIIGYGNMGRGHHRNITAGSVPGVELAAICDRDPEALEGLDDSIQLFDDAKAMITSGVIEAVLIATPHYDHTTLGIAALKAGLHVMVEKPISVHVADCQRLIDAYEARPKKKQVFAAMFNQRTDPRYQKIRQLIQDGEIGEFRRVNWIITDWFRTDFYYASGGWRATWKGEGGGVLLNQCPHQLDLLWWLCGTPESVQATCRFGQWHDVEVEDDVTAVLQYPNGASGVFVTTTGEAPGTNRLEIVGTRGKVVAEGDGITFIRNEVPMDVQCRKATAGFTKPPVWNIDIPTHGRGGQHAEILQNFAEAVRGKAKLIAPAVEGIHSVGLANAMLLSAWQNKAVTLPVPAATYERKLKALWKTSAYDQKVAKKGGKTKRAKGNDMASSF